MPGPGGQSDSTLPTGTSPSPHSPETSAGLCALIPWGSGRVFSGRGDSQLHGTHPSSGRVDSVRSFHSAQKASRRSRSSSDTWQISSAVAMISAHWLSALLLPGPLNSPLLHLLQGLFSAPLASDAISRAKAHRWGTLGPEWGWGSLGSSRRLGSAVSFSRDQDAPLGAEVLRVTPPGV